MSKVPQLVEALPLDRLHPHPDNPRLTLRQDTIDQIAAEVSRSGFGAQHAITVRPAGDDWQIIAGHHRVAAATAAGLDGIPAWVIEMDDDEAFMQLVLANSQGELSPLEIGVHALHAVPLAQGSRSGGGLAAYAERIKRGDESVRQWRKAAEVYTALPKTFREVGLEGRHQNLFEISKAPRKVWQPLVEGLTKRSWSVADTAAEVGQIRRLAEVVPSEHRDWLPVGALGDAYLRGGRMKATAVSALVAAADEVFALADDQGIDADAVEFHAWLVENSGGDSWDVRKIREQHQVLMTRIWERRDAEKVVELPDGIDLRVGAFQTALADIPAGSVDVIITDPPYPEEFLPLFSDLSEHAARLLKPGGICAVMVGQSYLPEVINRLGEHLVWHWELDYGTPGGQAVQVWPRKVNSFRKPILLFRSVGDYDGDWIGDAVKSDVNDNDKAHHHWGQSESGMSDLVERLSRPGWLVCDPFLGGGTTAVVCHELGRRFVGCDVEESCVATTRERFTADDEAGAA